MSKKDKRIAFKIYPDRKKLYYEVIIFPTRDDMKEFVKRSMKTLHANGFDENMGGCTLRGKFYKDAERKKLISCLGIVAFCEEYFVGEVISHEMVHATVGYFFRKKIKSIFEDYKHEEYFCHVQGDLVQQTMEKYIKKVKPRV